MNILIALVLATAPPEEQPWFCEEYIAVGDLPYPGCVWEGGRYDREELRHRLACGPAGVAELHPRHCGQPKFCAGSSSRADDPYVQMLVREGLSLKSAQEKASINRTNGCP